MPSSAIDALEHDRRVEVRERRRRRRVRQVVGRNVDGLERRDRPLLGRRNPFLEHAHLGGQRRLIADGARGAAEQRRHLGARLREPENVVDEEQHVLVLLVAEVLGDGEAAQRDAQARARAARSSARRRARSSDAPRSFWLMTPACDISW